MAEGAVTATFDFAVAADALITAAGQSQEALGKLRDRYEQNAQAIKNLQSAQRGLAAGGLKTSDSYAALSDKLKALRVETARMGAAYLELGGDLTAAAPGKAAAAEAAKAERALEALRVKEERAAEAAAAKASALAEKQAAEAEALAVKRRAAAGQDTAADALVATSGRSSGALRRMRAEYDGNEQTLSRLTAAQSKFAEGSKGYDQLGSRIAGLRQRNTSLGQSYVRLGGDFSKASPKPFKLDLEALTKVAGQVPGPLGMIAQKANGLAGAMGGGGLAQVLGLAGAGLASIAVVAASAAAALVTFGVAMTSSATKQELQLRSFGALGKGLAYTEDQAHGFIDAIESVAESSALGADEVGAYAQKLIEAGVKPKDLESALRATTQIAATQGDSYANAFATKVASSSKAGSSIVKMVTDVNAKLGPLADEAYGSIGTQLVKLKDAFVSGFDDLDLSGLAGAIAQVTKSVSDMFGGAKKQGKSLTQSLIDGLAYGIDKVNVWSLKFEGIWLRLQIKFLKGLKRLDDAWSGSAVGSLISKTRNVFEDAARGGKAGPADPRSATYSIDEVRERMAARTAAAAGRPIVSLPVGGAAGGYGVDLSGARRPALRDVPVTVNINGPATADDAKMIGELTGRSVARELRSVELAWGTQ